MHFRVLFFLVGTVSVIFGKDGSGKSYYQLRLIKDELLSTARNIVTNLALDVGKLAEYFNKYWPKLSIDVARRIRILAKEEAGHFWDIRGNDRIVDYSSDPVGYPYRMTPDTGVDGVMYVIDEAGVVGFRASAWAQRENGTTRGERCLFYIDQHRKLGDRVYMSLFGTNPHGIAKPLRDAAGEYIQLRNGRQRKMGIFKARGIFTAWHYYSEPSPTVEHFGKYDFPFDLELMGCYRTAEGMGVSGTKADMGSKVSGIPVLWAFPMAIGIGSLCFIGPWALGHLLNRHIVGTSKAVNVGVSRTVAALGGSAGLVPSKHPGSIDSDLTVSGYCEWAEPEMVGYPPRPNPTGGTHYSLTFADGSRTDSSEAFIKQVGRDLFSVDGTIYRYVHKVEAAAVEATGIPERERP